MLNEFIESVKTLQRKEEFLTNIMAVLTEYFYRKDVCHVVTPYNEENLRNLIKEYYELGYSNSEKK